MIKQFVRYYWPTIILVIVIFILSTVHFNAVPKIANFKSSDKYAHILIYLLLGFVVYFNYSKDQFLRIKYPNLIFTLFAILILYGGAIEIIQELFFKPRSAELLDWVADMVGLVSGGMIGRYIFNKD